MAMVAGNPRNRMFLALILQRRAEILLRLGRFADAGVEAERAVQAAVAEMGEGRWSTAVGLAHLAAGEAYAGEGRADDARRALDEALRHLDAGGGPEHPAARRARRVRDRLGSGRGE